MAFAPLLNDLIQLHGLEFGRAFDLGRSPVESASTAIDQFLAFYLSGTGDSQHRGESFYRKDGDRHGAVHCPACASRNAGLGSSVESATHSSICAGSVRRSLFRRTAGA